MVLRCKLSRLGMTRPSNSNNSEITTKVSSNLRQQPDLTILMAITGIVTSLQLLGVRRGALFVAFITMKTTTRQITHHRSFSRSRNSCQTSGYDNDD